MHNRTHITNTYKHSTKINKRLPTGDADIMITDMIMIMIMMRMMIVMILLVMQPTISNIIIN